MAVARNSQAFSIAILVVVLSACASSLDKNSIRSIASPDEEISCPQALGTILSNKKWWQREEKSVLQDSGLLKELLDQNHMDNLLDRLEPQEIPARSSRLSIRISELDAALTVGSKEKAYRLTRKAYLNVHSSVGKIKYAKALIRFTEESELTQVQKKFLLKQARLLHRDASRELGKSFAEFATISSFLKSVTESTTCTNPTCQDLAQTLRNTLGVEHEVGERALREQLQAYDVTLTAGAGETIELSSRVPLSTIEFSESHKAFRESNEAIRSSLRNSRKADFFFLIRSVLTDSSTSGLIYAAFSKIPPLAPILNHPEIAKIWFKEAINIQARKYHGPFLSLLYRSNAPLQAKFARLKGYAAARPEVLVTLRRRTDLNLFWDDLIKEAKANSWDDRFVAQMEAQNEAGSMSEKLGPLSPADKKGAVSRLTRLGLVAGLSGWGGYEGSQKALEIYNNLSDEDREVIEDIQTVIHAEIDDPEPQQQTQP